MTSTPRLGGHARARPAGRRREDAAAVVARLFESTTARLLHLPLDEHDPQMADVLTLAHATAIAFATVVRESPEVYFEIQAKNPNSMTAIARLAEAIARVSAAVSSQDANAFRALMEEGQRRAV